MYKVPESFEAACNVTGTDPKFLPNIEGLSDITAKRHIADYKLEILHKATVGKWKADFANASQWKYTPWLKFSPSLGAFVYALHEHGRVPRCPLLVPGIRNRGRIWQ
jgi:hypothetical protein